jgi:hypothetical protein
VLRAGKQEPNDRSLAERREVADPALQAIALTARGRIEKLSGVAASLGETGHVSVVIKITAWRLGTKAPPRRRPG